MLGGGGKCSLCGSSLSNRSMYRSRGFISSKASTTCVCNMGVDCWNLDYMAHAAALSLWRAHQGSVRTSMFTATMNNMRPVASSNGLSEIMLLNELPSFR